MNCYGLFGRILGHKYEARYSKSAPTLQLKTLDSLAFAEEMCSILECSKTITYHCDVCIRCGDFVKPEAAA